MPDWLNIIVQLWPIASAITPLILLGGFYWLQTKFPTKVEFEAVATKVGDLEGSQIKMAAEVHALSADRDAHPTRIEMLNRIAGLEARVGGLESGLQGVSRQLGTANEYLQILVERGLGR